MQAVDNMNKSELIIYLMGEYQAALQDFEAENAWKAEYYEVGEQLRLKDKEDGGERFRAYYDYYNGRHVPKAELTRIRLMLQKAMLEVERG